MEIIPLVYIKDRKPRLEGREHPSLLAEVLEQLDEGSSIYFLDADGIEKDKPNLCTYQRLPSRQNMWIDAGPRVLGDVVDVVMAGATTIIVRQNLWPKLDIGRIKEFTENEIYMGVDLKHKLYVYESNPENVYYWEKRGAVGLLVDINKIERFKNHGF